jgi:hypothetical protein
MSMAVVVQCFVKLDTLQGLLQSLLACEGHEQLSLIIWRDSARGSRRELEFIPAGEAVGAFIHEFVGQYRESFRTIDVYENPWNLGCYKTCQLAIDAAFKTNDEIIFAEDDIVFSRDALLWFSEVFRRGLLQQPEIWAIAGESIFFDSKEKTVDQPFIAAAVKTAREQDLVHKYTMHGFIPSACFATTRDKWAEFGATRGETNGDVSLCQRCKDEGRYAIFPVVARAKDVGMLHDFGYSVSIHTKAGVQAITQPYLLAEDVLPAGPVGRLDLQRFEGDAGRLFQQSTQLAGFSAGAQAGLRDASVQPSLAADAESGAPAKEIVQTHVTTLDTAADGQLARAVKTALNRAVRGEGKLPLELRVAPGLSGQKYRLFINTFVELTKDPRYVEIGVGHGSTFYSAVYGNRVTALGIDNWAEFDGIGNKELQELCRSRAPESQVVLVERDFRNVDFSTVGRYNIYFYDGPHGPEDQFKGVVLIQPALDDQFVMIIDDWNWSWVRSGALQGIQEAGLSIDYFAEIRTSTDDTQPTWNGAQSDWHNGYFIAVCSKR